MLQLIQVLSMQLTSSVDATQDSAPDSNSVLEGYSFCRTVTSSNAITLPNDYTHEISFSGNPVDFETLTVLSGTCESPDSERGFFVDGDNVFVKSETPDELSYAFAYGNPVIQNKSSGEDAFLFFEDFGGPILDMSKWSVDTGSDPGNCATQNFSINGGIFQIEAKSSSVYSCEHAIATKETFSPPAKLEFFHLKHSNWAELEIPDTIEIQLKVLKDLQNVHISLLMSMEGLHMPMLLNLLTIHFLIRQIRLILLWFGRMIRHNQQ